MARPATKSVNLKLPKPRKYREKRFVGSGPTDRELQRVLKKKYQPTLGPALRDYVNWFNSFASRSLVKTRTESRLEAQSLIDACEVICNIFERQGNPEQVGTSVQSFIDAQFVGKTINISVQHGIGICDCDDGKFLYRLHLLSQLAKEFLAELDSEGQAHGNRRDPLLHHLIDLIVPVLEQHGIRIGHSLTSHCCEILKLVLKNVGAKTTDPRIYLNTP